MFDIVGHHCSGLVALEFIVNGGFQNRAIGAAHEKESGWLVGALVLEALVDIQGSDPAMRFVLNIDTE